MRDVSSTCKCYKDNVFILNVYYKKLFRNVYVKSTNNKIIKRKCHQYNASTDVYLNGVLTVFPIPTHICMYMHFVGS